MGLELGVRGWVGEQSLCPRGNPNLDQEAALIPLNPSPIPKPLAAYRDAAGGQDVVEALRKAWVASGAKESGESRRLYMEGAWGGFTCG